MVAPAVTITTPPLLLLRTLRSPATLAARPVKPLLAEVRLVTPAALEVTSSDPPRMRPSVVAPAA